MVLGPPGATSPPGCRAVSLSSTTPTECFPSAPTTRWSHLRRLTTTISRGCMKRVQLHGRETDSAVASRLLADWDAAAASFVKVMPTDFKRVLEAAAAARAEGRDETEAVMAAARA